MYLEDLLPALDIGTVEGHLSVETTWAKQGRIEDLRAVGRGHDDHALVCVEAVHLHQQLVESLLAFIVSADRVEPASLSERIQLIDEDDTGGFFLSLGEEVAHPSRPDPHEHLHEIRPAEAEEWNPCLPGYSLGQQRFPGPWGPDAQHPLRNFPTKPTVSLGRLQEFDNLHQLSTRLVDPRHIGKGHAGLFLHVHFGLTLADRHQTARRSPDSLHEKHPHTNEDQGREHPGEQGNKPRALHLAGESHLRGLQVLDQGRIADPDGHESMLLTGQPLNLLHLLLREESFQPLPLQPPGDDTLTEGQVFHLAGFQEDLEIAVQEGLSTAGYQKIVNPQHKHEGSHEVPESKLPLLLFHRAHSLDQSPNTLQRTLKPMIQSRHTGVITHVSSDSAYLSSAGWCS